MALAAPGGKWHPPRDRLAAEVVAAKAERVLAAMVQCGCTLNNAMIQHMFVALPVIPELRLTDMGLVDVTRFEMTDLFL